MRPRRLVRGLDADAVGILERYDWPGDVRELQTVIERAVICTAGATITSDDVMATLDRRAPRPSRRREVHDGDVERAIACAGGRFQDTAAALGISRTTLWRRQKTQRRQLTTPRGLAERA